MFRHPIARRLFVSVLAASLVGLVPAGCGNRGGNRAAGGGDGGKVPGALRYALTAEPTTLDPALVSDGPTIDVLQQMYEGLVGWGENNDIVPLLAAQMPEISADGREYTFVLRDGVTFTNGRTVTAEDVKYSLTRALDPKLGSPVAMTYLNDIEGADAVNAGKATELAGVTAVDPKTVRIRLVAPRAYFLGKLTYPTGYALAKEEVEKGPTTPGGAHSINETNSVGSGPFKMGSYARQSKVTLLANANYWGGAPKLSRIERPIVLSAETRRNLYDTGQLDLVELEKSRYAQDRENKELQSQIKAYDRPATFYLGMNQTSYAPFKDRRVRQAFAHAINKDDILQRVLQGVNKKAEGVVPVGIPGYDPNFKGLPYDPAKAKQLLAEAGFPEGKGLPPLTLTFREQQPDLSKTAQVIQAQLKEIGVSINVDEMEWGKFLKMTDDRQIDFFHMRWMADYLDPQNFLSVLLHSKAPENRTAYNNPAYDALLDKADASMNKEERIRLYRQAERLVVDDAPWVPIYYQRDLELVKPHVSGIRESLFGHLPHTQTTVQ